MVCKGRRRCMGGHAGGCDCQVHRLCEEPPAGDFGGGVMNLFSGDGRDAQWRPSPFPYFARGMDMPSFNQVLLMGNVTCDPQLRTMTTGNKVVEFALAVNLQYRPVQGEVCVE